MWLGRLGGESQVRLVDTGSTKGRYLGKDERGR